MIHYHNKNTYINEAQFQEHFKARKLANEYLWDKHMQRVERAHLKECIGSILAMALCVAVLIYCVLV